MNRITKKERAFSFALHGKSLKSKVIIKTNNTARNPYGRLRLAIKMQDGISKIK
jgi:hypothetical protein